jgi:hypothetical protein
MNLRPPLSRPPAPAAACPEVPWPACNDAARGSIALSQTLHLNYFTAAEAIDSALLAAQLFA